MPAEKIRPSFATNGGAGRVARKASNAQLAKCISASSNHDHKAFYAHLAKCIKISGLAACQARPRGSKAIADTHTQTDTDRHTHTHTLTDARTHKHTHTSTTSLRTPYTHKTTHTKHPTYNNITHPPPT